MRVMMKTRNKKNEELPGLLGVSPVLKQPKNTHKRRKNTKRKLDKKHKQRMLGSHLCSPDSTFVLSSLLLLSPHFSLSFSCSSS